VSCDAERVTGFVDGGLGPEDAARVAAHLEGCAACRAQVEAEAELRARLARLPDPPLPAGLDRRVRESVRRRPARARSLARWALPLAASLVLGAWLREQPAVVAWDLARDHHKCFGRRPVPAKVWSGDPAEVESWFARRGTQPFPTLPDEVGGYALLGARYCPLVTLASAPHVYYDAGGRHVSVFLVPQGARFERRHASVARGSAVRLLQSGDAVLGIVGEDEAAVAEFEARLTPVQLARLAEALATASR
jgi:anti-sigma factor RsiW